MARRVVLSILTILALSGCRDGAPAPSGVADKVPTKTQSTYISMAPSNTEILFAIGSNDHLSGVCTQCDYPPEVVSVPKVGNFETPNIEKLASLRPSKAFLVDGQETMASMIEKQTAFKTAVTILKNRSIDDIAKNTIALGAATDHTSAANQAANQLRAQVASLQKVITDSAAPNSTKPKVFFCVWPEPLVAVGHGSYLDDAVTICGGTNISANLPGAYGRFNIEKLLLEQPDVIIMPNEAVRGIFDRPPWSSLEAVKKRHLYFLPPRSEDRLSRPTLRVVDGLYWLAECIHPELHSKLTMNKNSMSHLSATTTSKP